MAPLRCLYDLQHAPITFDFATFLAIADCVRQNAKMKHIDLTIRKAAFRQKTPRDFETPDSEKIWRIHGILLQVCAVVPSIRNLTVTEDTDGTFDFPSAKTALVPYCASFAVNAWEAGTDPRVLRAPEHAKSEVKKRWTDERYVTLTLRTSIHAPERNPDMGEWQRFHDWLRNQGYVVIVIPDQEDINRAGEALAGRWDLDIPAAYDFRLRLALYEGALMNVGSVNGPFGQCFMSHVPLLQFDHFRGNALSADQWVDLNGFPPPGQYPWSAKNQRMTWLDSTFENLKAEFERVVG